ncbi:TlpA family protein disulfide reductase [Sanyastnella coralliicola]|uniref:TlpA family protein disulfide reductase n=1 Tax=Sanyastnella coralliicola TaxID=3069118 RepID=UPI0027B998FC|nr:TlpA family protein disulfide reductase [Longitalea sp. SCSIO 12813]
MINSILKFSLILALGMFTIHADAQDNKIRLKIKGVENQEVYLANYYGEKLYYNDTTMADANGYFEFQGKPFEECGKYAVVAPGPKFFDIIVSQEDIYLETDTSDLINNLTVHKSDENEQFFNYLHFIQRKRNARAPFDAVLADSLKSDKQKEQARAEIKQLNDDVQQYQKDLIAKHPELLFTKLMQMTLDVEVPEAPEGVEDAQTWKYYYYRNHYWDRVDFSDPRLVRDQMFHRVLDKYWTKVLPQIPDSLLKEAFALVERADNYDMFKYFTHHITYAAESSNIMCMDKVFVGMVDRYYRTGKADWLDEEATTKILDRAKDLRYTVCGEPVPNIILPDTTLTNWVNLYEIDSKYTVIAIWESTCGHCKKEMPKLQELSEEWSDKGLKVFAIGNDFETEPWVEFIRDKELDGWYHVSDNPAINATDSATKLISSGITTLLSLNFRSTFDVFSTPKVFLLDEDKRVIAKQLSAEQIGELLKRLEAEDNPTGDVPPAETPKEEKAVREERG